MTRDGHVTRSTSPISPDIPRYRPVSGFRHGRPCAGHPRRPAATISVTKKECLLSDVYPDRTVFSRIAGASPAMTPSVPPMPNAEEPTISCRKSEAKLSSSHERSCPSACPDRWRTSRRRRRLRAKGRAKFFPAKIPRNPLKRLVSDERIQGNPSFSNPQKLGFSRPNGHAPRKPKPTGRWDGEGG